MVKDFAQMKVEAGVLPFPPQILMLTKVRVFTPACFLSPLCHHPPDIQHMALKKNDHLQVTQCGYNDTYLRLN